MKYFHQVYHATLYSVAGFQRLIQETATQAEIIFYALVFAVFLWIGASTEQFVIMGMLFFLTLGLEALNTAVEVLVDHLTDEIAEFAKQAKDLGSFAVFCSLTATSLYGLFVVYQTL